MPLIRFAFAARRHPRAWRLLGGLLVMAALFALLLSAAEPVHGCDTASQGQADAQPSPAAPAGRSVASLPDCVR